MYVMTPHRNKSRKDYNSLSIFEIKSFYFYIEKN